MTTSRPKRPPAEGPETRGETIERIAPDAARRPDPSTRRRLGTRLTWTGHGAALLAGALAFVLVLAFGGGLPFAVALGGGVAVVGGVLVSLVMVEREDGRIDRMVDERVEEGRHERHA